MIMKQLILFLLALVPMMASAQAPQVIKDGITYRCYDDGAYITGTDETVTGDIVIPEMVTDEDGLEYNVSVIDENAFQDHAITSIVLPSTLTWIYEDAFQGCSSLTDVTLLGLTPPSSNKDAFYGGAFSSVKIHVPTEALDAYKADDYWKQFATIDDNVATGIHAAKAYASDSQTYDLQGRKLSQLHKGIVIRNGKKYITK